MAVADRQRTFPIQKYDGGWIVLKRLSSTYVPTNPTMFKREAIMTITQQWAAIGAIFWIASTWYAFALGRARGFNKGYQEARAFDEMVRDIRAAGQ